MCLPHKCKSPVNGHGDNYRGNLLNMDGNDSKNITE